MIQLKDNPNEGEFIRLMNLPKSHEYTAEEEHFLYLYFRDKKETEIKHVTQALEHYYNSTIDEHYKKYLEKRSK